MDIVITAIVAVVAIAIMLAILGTLFTKVYVKPKPDEALVISKTGKFEVAMNGGVVMPFVHRGEIIDLGLKTIKISRRGQDGLVCADNIRADVNVAFYVRIEKNEADILQVARSIGSENAGDIEKLRELLDAKFAEALKTAGRQMDFVDLYTNRAAMVAAVKDVLSDDLNGFTLSDVAIEYLEQTPLNELDPKNVTDAEGITKITSITEQERVKTNEHARESEKRVKAKDVETVQAIAELKRREAEAEATAAQQIREVRAAADSSARQAEEDARRAAEIATQRADQEVGVARENAQREIGTAEQNRHRVIAVEEIKVQRGRELERRAAEAAVIEARLAVEEQATVLSVKQQERVAAEKGVAAGEEEIATIRLIAEARRTADADVISAEALAKQAQIETVVTAEAERTAAEHIAHKELTQAQARRDAAERDSQAARLTAEGTKATAAAVGLGELEVKRQEVTLIRDEGEARAAARAAEAEATRVEGSAMAEVIRLEGEAKGHAERAELVGRAEGLDHEAAAQAKLQEAGLDAKLRTNEQEITRAIRLAEVDADKAARVASAEAYGVALSNATIDIVGGDDLFVHDMLAATGNGKRIDRTIDASDTLGGVAKPYLNGDRDLIAEIGQAVAGLGSDGIRNLTNAQLAHQVAGALGDSSIADRVQTLIETLRSGNGSTVVGS